VPSEVGRSVAANASSRPPGARCVAALSFPFLSFPSPPPFRFDVGRRGHVALSAPVLTGGASGGVEVYQCHCQWWRPVTSDFNLSQLYMADHATSLARAWPARRTAHLVVSRIRLFDDGSTLVVVADSQILAQIFHDSWYGAVRVGRHAYPAPAAACTGMSRQFRSVLAGCGGTYCMY
jgi:hypothetical protein